ncbi:hypothetical protein Y032_0243g3478 [Ancylostoma ceylanicum]|uniref:Uncharacterized protein n=1 Tax=Ancylostoma ceylanicum TaxID=53326 RepID=A0A016SE64_9BILA|nr:hypothetical protein Y032_0243g3478 [Ancylostoma ceylanicum]
MHADNLLFSHSSPTAAHFSSLLSSQLSFLNGNSASCVTSKGVHDAEILRSRLGSAQKLSMNLGWKMGFFGSFARNHICRSDQQSLKILLV